LDSRRPGATIRKKTTQAKKPKAPQSNIVQAKIVAPAAGGDAPMEVVMTTSSGPRKLAEAVAEKALRKKAEKAAKQARKERAKADAGAAPATDISALKGLYTQLATKGKFSVKGGKLFQRGKAHKATTKAAKMPIARPARPAKPDSKMGSTSPGGRKSSPKSAPAQQVPPFSLPESALPPVGKSSTPAAKASGAPASDATRKQRRKDTNKAIKVQKTAFRKQMQSRR
jgi:hypothetical protein